MRAKSYTFLAESCIWRQSLVFGCNVLYFCSKVSYVGVKSCILRQSLVLLLKILGFWCKVLCFECKVLYLAVKVLSFCGKVLYCWCKFLYLDAKSYMLGAKSCIRRQSLIVGPYYGTHIPPQCAVWPQNNYFAYDGYV